MNIRLVLSDIDNTLIPFGCERVSTRAARAIREVQARGVRFGLATGRDVQELLRFFGGDSSAFETGILSNGKKIYADGELAQLTCLDVASLQVLADYLRGFEGCFMVAYPLKTDMANPAWCVHPSMAAVAPFARRFRFTPTLAGRVPDEQIIGATIACPLDQERFDAIKREAAALCPALDILQPVTHWADVVPRGLNKGTALPVLLEKLGVDAREVLFFGDAENDLGIMEGVGYPVAVANATPAARKAARHHIGPCGDDAVAAALEELAQALDAGTPPRFLQRQ